MRPFVMCGVMIAAMLVSRSGIDAQKGVKVSDNNGQLEVQINGIPFTTYIYSSKYPKTFFHPIRDARGVAVSRGYPLDPLEEGERPDHPHHKGIWFAHGNVNGVDFWGEKGKIVHRSFANISDKTNVVSWDEKLDWLALDGKVLLNESRRVTIRAHGEALCLDFEATLTPAGDAVTFGDTKEGTFAIRVADSMRGDKHGLLEDSEGRKTEKQCWGKRASWCDYSGIVKGERVGIAILDHPKSLRHPVYWHVRDYGLHAANPFGIHDFNKSATERGDFTLKGGMTMVFKYRVLVHKGDAKEGKVAEEYASYAKS